MTGLLSLVIAYLLGSIPVGYLLAKLTTGKDVRTVGSGNIGATNVARAAGKWSGIATLVLDAAKGWLAVWIAARLTDGSVGWMSDAALAVMAGHVFPVFLSFKGGKAVATGLGAFAFLTPLPVLASVVVFAVTLAMTRYVSAASVTASGTFPLGVWLIMHPPFVVIVISILAAGLIVYRHKSNLQRIRAGTEQSIRWKIS